MIEPMRSYLVLLNDFVDGSIGGAAFEQQFIHKFKNETEFFPEPMFTVLNRLFGDVDAYCDDPILRDSSDLSEEQLREKVAEALRQLNDLLGDDRVTQ